MGQLFLAASLLALCVSSALGIVYTTHMTRQSYADISIKQSLISDYQVQFGRLKIEEGTFSEPSRVERAARENLGMAMPGFSESVMIVR